MRIVIRAIRSPAGSQLKAYAEYRVFSRLARLADQIRFVWVTVRRARDGNTECAITAALGRGGRTRVRRRRPEPSGAIDAAVDDLAAATSARAAE